jgi:hypothetical protein
MGNQVPFSSLSPMSSRLLLSKSAEEYPKMNLGLLRLGLVRG